MKRRVSTYKVTYCMFFITIFLPGQRPHRETLLHNFFFETSGVDSHEKRRRHHRQHLIKQQGLHCFLIASVTDLLSAVTHHGQTCSLAGSNPRKFQVFSLWKYSSEEGYS